ncbi:hypothetical protein M378DRAFT_419010 [Amanita muscaria Koide BX008]|uniref:Uncharacterized protein n=1 Tax=Amanita muscaria (strain Koide BX008) TaxID=946122 RepID=A0A0C2WLS5_AMAMK|nr:hypothetical protein M378DRAFT_419010 [Amanita muscaria Koide BX008]
MCSLWRRCHVMVVLNRSRKFWLSGSPRYTWEELKWCPSPSSCGASSSAKPDAIKSAFSLWRSRCELTVAVGITGIADDTVGGMGNCI